VAFQIFITDSAQKEIDSLPWKQKLMVEDRIERLADDPRPVGCIALHGKQFKGLYRVRSGNYRIIYQVQDASLSVSVVKVGDRKEVYG
jgi:mRNA interferase RelE/StbE